MTVHTRAHDERGSYLVVECRGGRFLIDEADEETLGGYRWFVFPSKGQFYVARSRWIPEAAKSAIVLLHREIMQPPDDMYIDHCDSDGLNNRRFNMRICTMAQNNMNVRNRKRGVSGFIGVYPNGYGRWYAMVATGKGKLKALGTFDDPIAAAKARDAAALTIRGEFACLNFPIKSD